MDNFKKIERIVDIFIAKRERDLTTEEKTILDNWLKEDKENKIISQFLKTESNIPSKLKLLSEFDKVYAYQNFTKQIKKHKVKTISISILRYAAIIIPLVIGFYVIYQYNNVKLKADNEIATSKIQPVSSKATLVLADGRKIDLNENKQKIAEYDGTVINNTKNHLVYQPHTAPKKTDEIQYNIIEIPRGGEYQLNLADGSKVWLNSETTIRFPVNFTQDVREIYLEGEAFFEVTRDEKKPFIVSTTRMKINVVGTAFNIKAYNNEKQTATTLVNGKVKIHDSHTGKQFSLLPNQQAVTSNEGTAIIPVNIEQFTAWKNGRILFEENSLAEILNDISRWYDIDIVYDDPQIQKLRYSIDMKRYDQFKDILDLLELTQRIKFTIDEKTVTIKKY